MRIGKRMRKIPKIGKANKKILKMLRRNGRITYKEVANGIDRTQSTVRDVLGYRTGEDPCDYRPEDDGLCHFVIQCKAGPDQLDEVTRKLHRIGNILQVYHTSGDRNLTVMIATSDYDEMKRILSEKIASVGISDMKVMIAKRNNRITNKEAARKPGTLRDILGCPSGEDTYEYVYLEYDGSHQDCGDDYKYPGDNKA